MSPETPDPDYQDAVDRYLFLCRRFRERPVRSRDGGFNPYGNHSAQLEIFAMREDIGHAKEQETKK